MAYDGPPNFQELTLDASYHPSGVSAADTSIRVNEDLTGYPSTGYLTWERETPAKREITKWTSVNIGTKTFTVGRGGASGDGTTARTHATTATIAVTPNKGYFDDLEAEISTLIGAPPVGVGSVTPAAGAFTTLSATGAVTFASGLTIPNLTITAVSGVPLTITAPTAQSALVLTYPDDGTTKILSFTDSTLSFERVSYIGGVLNLEQGVASGGRVTLDDSGSILVTRSSSGNPPHIDIDQGNVDAATIPYLRINSSDGSSWYFFVTNAGVLRVKKGSKPTAASDGSAV